MLLTFRFHSLSSTGETPNINRVLFKAREGISQGRGSTFSTEGLSRILRGEYPKVVGTEWLEAWEGEEEPLANTFLIHMQVKRKKAYIKSTGRTIS